MRSFEGPALAAALTIGVVACSSSDETLGQSRAVDASGGIPGAGGSIATGGRTGASGSGGLLGSGGAAGRGAGGVSTGGAVVGGAGSAGRGTGGVADGSAGATGGSAGSDGGSLLPACASATPLPNVTKTCRAQSDCAGEICSHDAPGDGQCDLYCINARTCTADQDCTLGNEVCDVREGACVCPPPIHARCTYKCINSTECWSGSTCLPDGHCSPNSCATGGYPCPAGTLCGVSLESDRHGCRPAKCNTLDGYACPSGFECMPAGAGADVHGCVPIPCPRFTCAENFDCGGSNPDDHGCVQRGCTADSACDCGACVTGRCEDRLFGCFPPPPP